MKNPESASVSLLIFLFVCIFATPCFSEESQSDFQISVGAKAIFNFWTMGRWELKGMETEKDISSASGLVTGPAVKMGYRNFFGGISLLTSLKSYESSIVQSHTSEYSGYIDKRITTDIEADRRDIDIIAGYMVHPRLGLFAGYKMINYDYSVKYTAVTFNTDNDDISDNDTRDGGIESKGPAFGIAANYPVPDTRFVVYGFLTYMKLDHDYDSPGDGDYSASGDGFSVEPGVLYSINDYLSVNAGIKYQLIQYDDSYGDDSFTGFSVGCDYRF